MSTIDYSKWDKIDCSSSDDDDDDSHDSSSKRRPRVTRLTGPSRVTRTVHGDLIVEEEQDAIHEDNNQTTMTTMPNDIDHNNLTQPSLSVESNNPCLSNKESILSQSPASSASAAATAAVEAWTRNGSREVIPSSNQTLYWSQDRSSVYLRVSLPSIEIRGKDIMVQLKGVKNYSHRFSAVGNTTTASIRVTYHSNDNNDNNMVVLLEGEFPHPIHASEDEDDYMNEDTVYTSSDWSIDRPTTTTTTTVSSNSNESKHSTQPQQAYWVMSLSKAMPMEGVVIWWRQPLTQFPEIDVHQANPNATTQNSQAFQQAWEEAHRQFRDKSKQKMTLP